MNRFNLVNLPETYSLYPVDEAEKCTRNYLFNNKVDLAAVAVDAPRLELGLEFLFEVMKTNIYCSYLPLREDIKNKPQGVEKEI